MPNNKFEEKTISRKTIYEGSIIDVVLDEVSLPNGGKAQRELVFHNGAVGILAVTEENKIILVKQYRKPLERVIVEIPAGKIEREDKNVCETARRELEEETGYQAKEMNLLMEFATSPGFANEIFYLYRGVDLIKVENPLPQDEDETIELLELTLAEAKEAIANGTVYDAKTIMAIQYWELQG